MPVNRGLPCEPGVGLSGLIRGVVRKRVVLVRRIRSARHGLPLRRGGLDDEGDDRCRPAQGGRTRRRCAMGGSVNSGGSPCAPAAARSASCSSGRMVSRRGRGRWAGLSACPAVGRRRWDGARCAGDAGRAVVPSWAQASPRRPTSTMPFVRAGRVAHPVAGGGPPGDRVTVCRLLAKRHTDVARWRTKQCCRLHAWVAELVPGGIGKEVVFNQARSMTRARRARRRGSGRAALPSTRAGRRHLHQVRSAGLRVEPFGRLASSAGKDRFGFPCAALRTTPSRAGVTRIG